MAKISSRTDAYSFLARAAIYGNLGLFIGAGFSKAVLNKPGGATPLSWRDLLAAAANLLEVDFDQFEKPGWSYPEMATAFCRRVAQVQKTQYAAAVSQLKAAIANLTSW